MTDKIEKIKMNQDKITNIVVSVIIILSVIADIRLLFSNRSLWWDEAAVTEGIITRNYSNLVRTELAHLQSAPIIWLYLEKIFATVWGNNEVALRLQGLIGYCILLTFVYLLDREALKLKYSILPVGFVASMSYLIRYSNQVKPYITDAMCTLIVFYIFYKYVDKKISLRALIIVWTVIIWYSNPTCFAEAGCLIIYGISSFKEKKWDELKRYILIGILILLSFLIYYKCWLSLSVDGMQNWWEGSEFSLSNLNTFNDAIIGYIGKGKYVILLLFLIGFCVTIYEKNEFILSMYAMIIITLIASNRGYYPLTGRLWCFSYPFFVMNAFYALEKILTKIKLKNVMQIIMLLLVCSNIGFTKYIISPEKNYIAASEINTELDYIDDNLNSVDAIYVIKDSILAFEFKNNYNNETYKDTDIRIYMESGEGLAEDAEKIFNYNKVYIVTTGIYDDAIETINRIEDIAKGYGEINLVSNEYESKLWLFKKY